ncbi:MAG: ATP-binding protein [Anaerolineae bacterium]
MTVQPPTDRTLQSLLDSQGRDRTYRWALVVVPLICGALAFLLLNALLGGTSDHPLTLMLTALVASGVVMASHAGLRHRIRKILQEPPRAKRISQAVRAVEQVATGDSDREAIMATLGREIEAVLDPAAFETALFIPSTNRYRIERHTGEREPVDAGSLSANHPFTTWMRQQPAGVPVRLSEARLPVDADPARTEMLTRGIDLVVPLDRQGWLGLALPTARGEFTATHRNLLQFLCRSASIGLQRAALVEAQHKRAEELRSLYGIAQAISFSMDLDEVLDLVVRNAADLLNSEAGSLLLLDEESGDLVLRISSDPAAAQLVGRRIASGKGIAGAAFLENQPVTIQNTRTDSRWDAAFDQKSEFVTESVIAVPLNAHGRTIGVLEVLNQKDRRQFSEEDSELLLSFAAQAAIAIENARLFQQVQQANEAKTEFISFVSHELKQPMTSIKGYADLLTKGVGGDLNDQQVRFVEVIGSNVTRMDGIVQDLLDVSRIESGRLKLRMESIAPEDIAIEAAHALEQEIAAKNQRLTVHVPEDLPTVLGDRDRLVQVLTNLISNASKYTEEGGDILVQAESRTQDGREHIVWSVSDTGVGMTPEEMDHLFTKYFRSQNPAVRSVQGTGLGLVISKSIIEMHGGYIAVESKAGKGSTFSFSVPTAQTVAQSE